MTAICHYIQGGPLSSEASRLSEAAHLVFFSTTVSPEAVPTHFVDEVLPTALQPRMEAFAGF